MATIDDFGKLDMRVGKVVKVEDFPEARKPMYKLTVDFGDEIGIKKSCAQIVKNQTKEELMGKLVVCVVNFKPRQVGPFLSEVLTMGSDDGTDEPSNWVILTTFKNVPVGSKVR